MRARTMRSRTAMDEAANEESHRLDRDFEMEKDIEMRSRGRARSSIPEKNIAHFAAIPSRESTLESRAAGRRWAAAERTTSLSIVPVCPHSLR